MRKATKTSKLPHNRTRSKKQDDNEKHKFLFGLVFNEFIKMEQEGVIRTNSQIAELASKKLGYTVRTGLINYILTRIWKKAREEESEILLNMLEKRKYTLQLKGPHSQKKQR
jgi:hypothetical protein